MKLRITCNDSEAGLTGFPLCEGQHFDVDDKGEFVNLADRTDTTASQEQFLNTHPAVESYQVEQ